MFVDASVMIAIITGEHDAERLAGLLEQSRRPLTSVLAVWETTVGLYRKKSIPMQEAEARVTEFLELCGIRIVETSQAELPIALQAFDRYGRHRYPDADRNSALNLADCFHYANAKAQRAPILTKDVGFALTDIEAIGVARS